MNVTDFIGIGKENAVTRGELVAILNLPDRQIRKLIQEARDRGEIIINAQDGAGYYKSDDEGELKRQYLTNQNRAMSILRQQKHIRKKLLALAADGQVSLEDLVCFRVEHEQLAPDISEIDQGVSAHG